jgi:ribosomal protein L29
MSIKKNKNDLPTTPELLDMVWETEERIIAIMNAKPTNTDPDIEGMTDEQREELLTDLKKRQQDFYSQLSEKVDNTARWHDHIKNKIEVMKSEIASMQKSKKEYENALKNLREFLAWKMDSLDIPVLAGNLKRMVIVRKPYVKPREMELTSQHFLDLNDGEYDIVGRQYSWNRSALKAAYETNKEAYEKYVETGITSYIQFKKI